MTAVVDVDDECRDARPTYNVADEKPGTVLEGPANPFLDGIYERIRIPASPGKYKEFMNSGVSSSLHRC